MTCGWLLIAPASVYWLLRAPPSEKGLMVKLSVQVARRERTKSDVKTSKRPDMLTGFWLLAEVTSLGTTTWLVREEVARALLSSPALDVRLLTALHCCV